ncbi:Solute-binding protein OS=Streptomyces glaucescens OX=1907 GN=SGLAU_15450 PE=4 SV=1 [Streptomyces glaucescens]
MAQIGAYATRLLYPAAKLLSIPVQADFAGQLATAGQIDGARSRMPFAASTRLLLRQDPLRPKAGLTPPTAWEELRADAAALKAEGVKYPYALPLGPEEAQAKTMQWLLSGGGGYTDSSGGYGIDSPNRDLGQLVGKDLTGPVARQAQPRRRLRRVPPTGRSVLNGHPR